MKEFYTKFVNVQHELKAPRGQFNKFGNYKYRSCEDIVEAVKPILAKNGLILFISDELVLIGERYYIKATATITDGEDSISSTGYARESQEQKGMVDSQLTGATSSYARKYALNGLLAIDDTKDADTNEFVEQTTGLDPILVEEAKKVGINDLNKVATYFGKTLSTLTNEELQRAINKKKEK